MMPLKANVFIFAYNGIIVHYKTKFMKYLYAAYKC